MAQTPATSFADGDTIDYTPSSAVTAGDVVVIGTTPFVAVQAIAASAKGALAAQGIFKVPKDTSTFSAGDAVYWNATGSPVTGTASSGAATSTASGNNLMGTVTADAATGDSYVYVLLAATKRTTTIGGAVTADSVTGTSSTLPVQGLAAAQGGSATLQGGTSSTSGNAGGPALVTGGTAGATGVGGAATIAAGAGGSSSGNGGVASLTGGAGTAGNATGGVGSVTGGAGQGSAAGGVGKVVGGVGGATGAGGAAQLTGGASAGASGTAGACAIDAGSAAGGTKSYVAIGDANANTVYLARGSLAALQVGLTLTALGTVQSSTPTSAQLLGGILTQTGSTGAGTVTLPSGTALSTACSRTPVAGDTFDCYFYNLGGSQTLTITGATGTTVIGTAAVGTGKMAQMKFYNSGSNTWNIYCIVSA